MYRGTHVQNKPRRAQNTRDFKIQRRDDKGERRLKSEFAFFQSLSRLFLLTYFVKCRRTLLKLNSKEPNPSSEREIKFRRCLFTFSTSRVIRHFHVVVVQKRRRIVQKSVMHVQSCCFAYLTYCFRFVCLFFCFVLFCLFLSTSNLHGVNPVFNKTAS